MTAALSFASAAFAAAISFSVGPPGAAGRPFFGRLRLAADGCEVARLNAMLGGYDDLVADMKKLSRLPEGIPANAD